MSKITVVALDGKQQDLEFKPGDNLMEVLRDAGYEEVVAMCGGCCSCATCHVKIADQAAFQLSPVEEDEEILVSMADEYDESSSRLSCQVSMDDAQNGMTVTIVNPE
jgi:2Fe-2S ferredoxin